MSDTKQEMSAMIEAAKGIFQDAKIEILVIQFLSDFREGKLTLDEAQKLIMHIYTGRKQPD